MTGELGAFVIAAGGTGGHIVPGIALAHEIRAQKHGSLVVVRRDRAGSREQARPAGGLPARARGCGGLRREDDGPADRRSRQGPEGVPRGPRAAQEVPGARRDRRRRLRDRARADRRAVARHPDADPRVQRDPRRGQQVPQPVRDKNGRRAARGQHLFQEARRGDRDARAFGVLRDSAARPGRDDAPRPRLRRQPGLACHQPGMARAGVLLEKTGIEVIHQTGDQDLVATRQRYTRLPANWKLVPFLPKLWEEMAWADLVVCRAGALTVAELAAAGRPSILVPFVGGGEPSDRQRESALSEGRGRPHGGAAT